MPGNLPVSQEQQEPNKAELISAEDAWWASLAASGIEVQTCPIMYSVEEVLDYIGYYDED